MRVGSIFSGIGAPEVAWAGLGWEFRWCAEIEKFPSAVLAHHYPGIPNLGDVTKVDWDAVEPVDLLVFGSPCQSFSVAGKRLGLDDARGNLALFGLRVARQLRPRWLVFENVPGLLSSDGYRDFGAFLGLLGECGYHAAWRVLDAQYFGVPQRRRRIFVVGCLGNWATAAAVLFEPESLRGDSPQSRKTGQGIAGSLAASTGGCDENDAKDGRLIAFDARNGTLDPGATIPVQAGGDCKRGYSLNTIPLAFGGNRQNGSLDVATACNAKGGSGRMDFETETLIAAAVTCDQRHAFPEQNRGTVIAAPMSVGGDRVGANGYAGRRQEDDIIGCGQKGRNHAYASETSGCLQHKGLAATGNEAGTVMRHGMSVRRLTPRECERLQGFPDDYTLITHTGKPAADGPRYRALGNSMAVPVVRWLGERIAIVEAM